MQYIVDIVVSPEITDRGPATMQLIGSVEADTSQEAYDAAGKVLAYQLEFHQISDQTMAIIRITVTPDPEGEKAREKGLTAEQMGLNEGIVESMHMGVGGKDKDEDLSDDDLEDFWMGMDDLLRSGESDEPGDYEDGK